MRHFVTIGMNFVGPSTAGQWALDQALLHPFASVIFNQTNENLTTR